jgi:hypothetical protein
MKYTQKCARNSLTVRITMIICTSIKYSIGKTYESKFNPSIYEMKKMSIYN